MQHVQHVMCMQGAPHSSFESKTACVTPTCTEILCLQFSAIHPTTARIRVDRQLRANYGFRNLVRLTVPANWIRAAYSSCPREGEEEEEEGGGLGGAAGAARSAVPRCARSVVARAAVAVRDRPNSRALALRGCEQTAVRQGLVD